MISNEACVLAGKRVVEQPGEMYNPLYIYGGEGLGKTHLMHAIANALIARGHKRIVCKSAERFTTEMIAAIRDGSMQAFHHQYRHADVLMIDDIQFVTGKASTQEEFLCTFDVLFDLKKQLVLTSTCYPVDMTDLGKRMCSRFQSSFAAEIKIPSLERRLKILVKKAAVAEASLDEDVLALLASRFTTNIRELEGALTKLVAYARLTDKMMNLDLAKHILNDLLQDEPYIPFHT